MARDPLDLDVAEAIVPGEGSVAGSLIGHEGLASREERQHRVRLLPGLVADPGHQTDEGIKFVDREDDAHLVHVAGASVAAPLAFPRHVARLRPLEVRPYELGVELNPAGERNRRHNGGNRALQLVPQHERGLEGDPAIGRGEPERNAGQLAFDERKPFPGAEPRPRRRPRRRRRNRLPASAADPFLMAFAIGAVLR